MINNNFICKNCQKEVSTLEVLGSKNRNHCPYCLWSLHVDINDGDRKSKCLGIMQPVGLVFKEEGFDKYGKKNQGEIMIVHYCLKCGKVSINRISGNDNSQKILEILSDKINLPVEIKENNSLKLLNESNLKEINRQLIGDLV